MNTCVNMKCPFMSGCKFYNFPIEREDSCPHQDYFLWAAKQYEKQKRKDAREAAKKEETV